MPCYLAVSLASIAALMLAAPSGASAQEADTSAPPAKEPATVWERMLASARDVYGEEAMLRPNGASYDFFRDLLPPLRYVNAAFRHYPIVLGTTGGLHKPRLVSNGSAINARAALGTWLDPGFPVTFSVDGEEFGSDFGRLTGPRLAEGYLPVVRLEYASASGRFGQEVFAASGEPLSKQGVCFARFSAQSGRGGRVSARVGIEGPAEMRNGVLLNGAGEALVWCGDGWQWDDAGKQLTASVSPGSPAYLAVFTAPAQIQVSGPLTGRDYDSQRSSAVSMWQGLLARGMRVNTPEPVVNDAWRALVIGNFVLLKGDELVYSAGNQYERMFEQESGDAVRSLLLFGYGEEMMRTVPPLLDYVQQGLSFHDAAFKLQMLSHFYWITRDAELVRAQRDRWMREAQRIISGRNAETGLLPAENYCGDIHTQVMTLNSNGNAWRGLRDIGAVLADIGEAPESERLSGEARDFRRVILRAVRDSQVRDFSPPFIPVALFGAEKPYESITASMMGSYYNLLIPLVLGSGVLGDESEQVGWILDYLHQRGGICMGMVRFHQHSGLFANENGVDDLYSMRYVLTLLRRDQVERALVSFYGKLAHGLTRDTFIGGEGSSLVPLDEHGRPFYLPPCSSGNAFFLQTLRYLMVQDYDMDDDGRPDTLRLMFATPRRWLEDGKRIEIEKAPTAFGPVSVRMHSELHRGVVTARVSAPAMAPAKTLLRARVPDGWKAVSARAGASDLPVTADGAVDITGRTGELTVVFTVARTKGTASQ